MELLIVGVICIPIIFFLHRSFEKGKYKRCFYCDHWDFYNRQRYLYTGAAKCLLKEDTYTTSRNICKNWKKEQGR